MLKKLSIFFILFLTSKTMASELIYTPINPTFGGNPLNGSFLLGKAQSQNDHTEENDLLSSLNTSDPLSRFQEDLERTILNNIAREISQRAFGGEEGDGEITSYNTEQYTIVVDTADSTRVVVNITNNETGETTIIEVPVFN
ncbi:MAG: curli assembly protein CsgF [Pseudomonadota bacterium]